MAYFSSVTPYPGAPGAPFFDGQNITYFLDLYNQLCSDYRLSESEKINRLPWYCESFTGNYIKIQVKGADWASVRSILCKKYKNGDLDQLMNSRKFLEVLKKQVHSEDNDLIHYCQLFASISRDLVLRRRLDLYTQCQWFLQGLPERVVMEIFHRHDIDLEDDNSLDFEDLLKKTLVIVKRKKFLADFIQDKETDLVNKYAEPQEKVPTTPNNVELFTYPAQDLTSPTRFYTVQGTVREDIPVVRIHASRVEEVKTDEVNSGDNDCVLVSNPNKDFYENLEALFADPVDEDLVQLRVSSVELFEHVEGTRIGTRSLDIKSKKTVQRLELQAPKKDGVGTEKGRYPGLGGLVIGRLIQKAIKSEDHG